MKNFKKILTILFVSLCFGFAKAQLVMDNEGKIAIGVGVNEILKSDFSINDVGDDNTGVYFSSNRQSTLNVSRKGSHANNLTMNVAIIGFNSDINNVPTYGVYSGTNNAGSLGKGIGVLGYSGYTSSNFNFGVIGKLYRTVNGAAIYGTSVHNDLSGIDPEGRYAGFFNGDTRVIGTLTASSFVTTSDYRLKNNIRSLSTSDNCLSKLMNMNVVEFNNVQREFKTGETEESLRNFNKQHAELHGSDIGNDIEIFSENKDVTKMNWYGEDSPIINNKHYGLIAQELKEIYPDLVVESQDGYLAINYLEIIPLLIRSVQELKAELDASKGNSFPIQKARTRNTGVTDIDVVVTTLYQNAPNPFTESTVIRCDVAEDVAKADLYIYNMNGEQIAEYPLAERGETSVVIEGSSLNAGMYLYALIADGQVIDTKRMILTK